MNYVLLALVVVSLLAGLIAIGVGNRGWSWGTVTAAILTLLMAACYLVIASRMATYEWSWTEFVRRKQVQLAELRDGVVPEKPGGRFVPSPDKKPLDTLAVERDRWQRAFDRIDSWRSRHWSGCSFQPPAEGDAAREGSIEVPLVPPAAAAAGEGAVAAGEVPPPPEGEPPPTEAPPAEAKPAAAGAATGAAPFDEGGVVYLFDEQGVNAGGRYLGAMRILSVTTDPVRKTCTLKVVATEPADAYDKQVWSRDYERCVTVFDALPNDRWLAFSTTSKEGDSGGVMPLPVRRSIEDVEAIVGEAEKSVVDEVERHEAETIDDKEEWQRIRSRLDSGELLPGKYWATVKLDKDVTTLGERLIDEAAKGELLAGNEVDFDLQTAFALQDEGSGTIQKVFFRRPLRDAGTRLYGGLVGDGRADGVAIAADGIAGLAAATRSEIGRLRNSVAELEAAQASVREEAEATAKRKEAYATDLRSWTRDAAEAERVAAGFAAELDQATVRLAGVSREVIDRARQLRTAIRALSARIDAAAPPPARAAAAP